MTVLVGYPPSRQATDALQLGAMLARTAGVGLVVCAVAPAPWMPSMSQVDAEYRDAIFQQAERTLEQARAHAHGDVPTTFVTVRARSTASGLLKAAEQHGASIIVLGSSTAGMFGHITTSSVAARLLHSSPLPIAQATRGFRSEENERVTRVTVAYGGSKQDEALVGATQLAALDNVALRLAAFAVQPPPPVNARFSVEAEAVIKEWTQQMKVAARKTLTEHTDDTTMPARLEPAIGVGNNWADALDSIGWESGDVLVVGSGSAGPFSRVFLGSRAAKIIRSSPVPVVVVPRAAAGKFDPDPAERAY